MKQLRFDILRSARSAQELISGTEVETIVHNRAPQSHQSFVGNSLRTILISTAAVLALGGLIFVMDNGEQSPNISLPQSNITQKLQEQSSKTTTDNSENHSITISQKAETNSPSNTDNIVTEQLSPIQSVTPTEHQSIIAMNALVLQPDELQKIGITVENNTLKTRIQERDRSQLLITEIYISNNSRRSTSIHTSLSDTTVFLHPVLITYSSPNGLEQSFSHIVNKSTLLADALIPTISVNQISEDTKSIGSTLPLLNQLVPIRVVLPQTNDIVTLWYIPNQLLFASLPERYILPIKNELQVHTDITCKHIQREDACGAFRGKTTVFDICSSDAGAITQSAVYPNPAHGSAQCRYVLVQSRQCRIALYTAEGQFVKELLPWSEQSSGEQIVRLALDDIHGGLYLLSLTTQQGEQIIQRLFIQ